MVLLMLVTAVAQPPPGPNLVANPSFESTEGEVPVGWQLPGNYALSRTLARTGDCSLRGENRDPERYELAIHSVPLQPGRAYELSGWVRTEGVEGDGATICLEWGGADGWIGGAYPAGRSGDSEWFFIRATTKHLPAEVTNGHVTCYFRRGTTGVAWWDDIEVREISLPAMDTMLALPNARGELPPDGDCEVAVVCRLVPLETVKLEAPRVRLTITGNGVSVVSEHPVAPGEATAMVRGRVNAAQDPDRAAVELLDASGTVHWQTRYSLSRASVAPDQRKVYIDDRGRTIVDGEPFFPIGLYLGRMSPEDLDIIATSAVNCVMPYSSLADSIETTRSLLDAAAARGIKVLFSVKDCYEPHEHAWPVTSFGPWATTEEVVRGAVREFRDHPAILAWYVNDELPLTVRPSLERNFRWVAEEDPHHPAWAVLWQVHELFEYMGTCDVIGTDPYPVPEASVFRAAEWARMTVEATHGARGVWMVPQAHNWGIYSSDEAGREGKRAPNEAELRAMTYMHLAEGAKGLVYYSFFDMKRDYVESFDSHWERFTRIAGEVADLAPIVLGAEPAVGVSVMIEPPNPAAPPRWTHASLAYANRTYVIVAGAEEPLGRISIVHPGARECATMFTRRTIAVSPDGVIEDELGPLAAEVYVIATADR